MKPFRERNQLVIGIVGVVVIALVMLIAFNAGNLPLIGGGTTYAADFRDASGLKPDDEVRIAGVRVGKVEDLSLSGTHVVVSFKIDSGQLTLGSTTTASIRIKTLLGQKYLAVVPTGGGKLSGDIPTSRTTSPFDVVQAVSGLAQTVGDINTTQLAAAFDTISETFAGSPANLSSALTGLSKLSTTIASRDAQLGQLLASANTVTGLLADRRTQFQQLITDGNLLLAELNRRRVVIHTLLVSSTALANQLTALIVENRNQLKPALDQLHGVLSLLQANQNNLDAALQRFAPFVRTFANVLGNGRWFDSYIGCLLPPPPISPAACPESGQPTNPLGGGG
ncbi:MCE family protein [Fodinicola feengrottensis]|uniref:MCE family protein n=1 Tax=Fodinicola feengrottensis TaxID=435914 RepID=A0ABN2GBX0_9ACTN